MDFLNTTLNEFVLEYKNAMIEREKMWFERTANLVQENYQALKRNLWDSNILSKKDLYHKYLDKAVENLDNLNVDVDELNDFLSRVFDSKKLDETKLTIELRADEDIEKIRPDYLNLFTVQYDKGFRDILAGKMDEFKFSDFTGGAFFDKLKKQLVKTSLKLNDVRDLMQLESPQVVSANSEFVQEAAIFFIRQYAQNVKEVKSIAINARNQIDSAIDDMIITSNAIRDIVDSGIDIKTRLKLEKYEFNMEKNFLNTCAYLTAIIIRKISYYSFNITSYLNLYNTIYDFYPEGKLVLHEHTMNDELNSYVENVLDGKLNDFDNTELIYSFLHNGLNIIIPSIRRAIDEKKFDIEDVLNRKYGRKIDYGTTLNVKDTAYDLKPYAIANKSIKDILNNVTTFELNCSNINMTVDDIILSASLDETFSSKYAGVLSSIASVSYYTDKYLKGLENTKGDALFALYADIHNFEDNIEIISKNALECYEKIKGIGKILEVNTLDIDPISFKELQSFQETLIINYKDYLLLLVRRMVDRLDNLIDAFKDEELPIEVKIEDFVPYDYAINNYKEAFDELVTKEEEIFNELYQEYYLNKYSRDHAIHAVYEADDKKIPTTTVEVHDTVANDNKENP